MTTITLYSFQICHVLLLSAFASTGNTSLHSSIHLFQTPLTYAPTNSHRPG
jgi:hypothetical protein